MLKLYHNPKCSVSRKVLALLEEKKIAVEVVEYLKTPLNVSALNALAQKMEDPKTLLRTKEELAQTLGLIGVSAQSFIPAIAKNPILLNRPLVESKSQALVARPAELALDFLIDPN